MKQRTPIAKRLETMAAHPAETRRPSTLRTNRAALYGYAATCEDRTRIINERDTARRWNDTETAARLTAQIAKLPRSTRADRRESARAVLRVRRAEKHEEADRNG